jgi:hypothetical protein
VNLQINESDTTMKQPKWNALVKFGMVAGLCVLLASCGDSPESGQVGEVFILPGRFQCCGDPAQECSRRR